MSVGNVHVSQLPPPPVKKQKVVEPRVNKKTGEIIPPKKQVTGTFTLGLRTTLLQRRSLDLQIRVADHAYNYCVWLTRVKKVKHDKG
jgi:hypothetical protein